MSRKWMTQLSPDTRVCGKLFSTTTNTSAEEKVELGFELKVLESNFDLSSHHTSDLVINPGNYSPAEYLPIEPGEMGAGEKLSQCRTTGESPRGAEHFGQHSKIPSGQQGFQSSGQWKAFITETKLWKECLTHERVPMGQACWERNESGKACEKSALSATVGRKTLYKNCDLTTCQTHTGQKSCECGECEKTFITQQKKHSENGACAYDQCEKSSRCKSDITVQQNLPIEGMPYECDECGEAFHTKSGLMRHEGLHTWGKLYECKECGKTLCRKSSLTIHEKIHSGEKPYQCTKYRKAFRKNHNSGGIVEEFTQRRNPKNVMVSQTRR
ncbi:PREDICTED: zinc finger protein 569-like [Chinchilla lanigera]|uniref:zinc finger protein 569-like n=1 Tax=Chinchilla lanigera TaxID=34839 RepID=UPI00038F0056|nr:PREDICTED: zinc finger protein 569-like [Chinchilla lanigera]